MLLLSEYAIPGKDNAGAKPEGGDEAGVLEEQKGLDVQWGVAGTSWGGE